MAFGLGLTEITLSTGRVVDLYWARYADWLFTTPLLLLDLALLADVDRPTIGALVGVDVLMIVTGFAGAVVSYPPARFIF
jgi:bacteriorhodopsin